MNNKYEEVLSLAKNYFKRDSSIKEIEILRYLDYVARNDNIIHKSKLYPGDLAILNNLEKEEYLIQSPKEDIIKIHLKRSFYNFIDEIVTTFSGDFLSEDYFNKLTDAIPRLSDDEFHSSRHEKDNSQLMNDIDTWDTIVGFRECSKSTIPGPMLVVDGVMVMFEDKDLNKYWYHMSLLAFIDVAEKLGRDILI